MTEPTTKLLSERLSPDHPLCLLEAAPDLLQGCRCALADLEGLDYPSDPALLTMRQLRAAIGKAEGRRYRIDSSGNGLYLTITRLADFASVTLCGDDAVAFGKRLDATTDAYTDDDLCAEYDDVLTTDELDDRL